MPGKKEDKEKLMKEMEKALKGGAGPKASRYAMSVVGGLIPLVGGAVSGAASAWSEQEQRRLNDIFASWVKLQEDEIREIGITLFEVMSRLDQDDENVRKRIESPEYLKLVKKCFRDWSAAESEEKRVLIRNLLSNAAAASLCPDDAIRMFIEWISKYSEMHFSVIAEIYKNPGITRRSIWLNIRGEIAREDSADADLFKLLIYDLNTGHVIRQHRETDVAGNFLPKPRRPRGQGGGYKSAFDDEEPYELTELGKQFVHYTMNEIVPRLEGVGEKSE